MSHPRYQRMRLAVIRRHTDQYCLTEAVFYLTSSKSPGFHDQSKAGCSGLRALDAYLNKPGWGWELSVLTGESRLARPSAAFVDDLSRHVIHHCETELTRKCCFTKRVDGAYLTVVEAI